MILISGLQKTSLIDYPGRICTTIFLQGCNLRCPYCHNPALALRESGLPLIPEDEVLEHLRKRRGLIDGLCVTGGEPSLHPTLPSFLERVKSLGVLIKVDTNGTNPQMITDLINNSLIDYIAMDIKAPLEKYPSVVRTPVNLKDIEESVELIKGSGIEYEFRTTVVRGLIGAEDIIAIGQWLRGAKKYVLQQFKPAPRMLDPLIGAVVPYTCDEFIKFRELLQEYVDLVELRGIM